MILASKARALIVFLLGGGVALFGHYLLTTTDDENHVVVINRASATLQELSLNYRGELSGTWNAQRSVMLPGSLATCNFPGAFCDSDDLLVSHSKGRFHAEIDSIGRFGHTLVIELTDNDIALYWDGVARPEIRVPVKAK